jgi:hypothetical protein
LRRAAALTAAACALPDAPMCFYIANLLHLTECLAATAPGAVVVRRPPLRKRCQAPT